MYPQEPSKHRQAFFVAVALSLIADIFEFLIGFKLSSNQKKSSESDIKKTLARVADWYDKDEGHYEVDARRILSSSIAQLKMIDRS